MIYIIAILLVLFVVVEWLHLRAVRQHTSVLTVLHAEIAGLKKDEEKFDSKFDGGTIPK